MRLDDRQIERYSRQIVLAEVGPRGQEQLLRSHVVVNGSGRAAECVLAYLAAAGVGRLTAPRALHRVVDPDHTDVRLEELAGETPRGCDAIVLVAPDQGQVEAMYATARADLVTPDTVDGGTAGDRSVVFWIAGAHAAGTPPCPACASDALVDAPAIGDELATVRDSVLGTTVATEVVKALLGIGEPLRGRVVTYAPGDASVTVRAAASRADCACAAQGGTHP